MSAISFRQQTEQRELKKQIEGSTVVDIEVCKVEEVDSETMKLTVRRISSNTILQNIPFCMPGRYVDNGLFIMPEKGALAVLATTKRQQFFVIGFLSYSEAKDINEFFDSGDVLLQSKGAGFIKLDGLGHVILSSSSGSYTNSGNDLVSSDAVAVYSRTAAKEIISGSINGILTDSELYYNTQLSADISLEDLVNKVIAGYDIPDELVHRPTPVLSIKKGNVTDDNHTPIQLDLYSDSNLNPDACFLLEVLSSDGGVSCTIAIGVDGSVQIKANRLSLSCESLDVTQVKAMTPDLSSWDSVDDYVGR